jgi:3-hydroxybutyryl-CoA dehydrogenase
MSEQIERLAVVGAGFMGAGIAETAAVAGLEVVLRDIDQPGLDRARQRIETSLKRGVDGGKLDVAHAEIARSRLSFSTEMEAIAGAELVIEAVPEIESLKLTVFAEIDAVVAPEAVIASNTSSIPIAQLAGAISAPERVVGLHFFSPVPVMKLVEVVVALDTSPRTVALARGFVEQIAKVPIETGDRSGFVVNVLLVPYLMSAIRLYESGFATAEDIDTGMRLGAGHPMGPLTLCDMIGLDTLSLVADSMYAEFHREEYSAPPLLKRMVSAGRLGRKSGRGFYEYG